MPKKRKTDAKRGARAQAKRERRSGLYLSRGDPDFKALSEQLRVEGLALKDVAGDGNCLFRALAEQLADHHSNLRCTAVKHIRDHSADYIPFVDEDTSFEAYVSELAKDGTYAGNDAIVAVSRACAVNVVIHQLGAPHWEVLAPLAPESRQTLHIAYLRGEHYCTVCPLEGHALPKVGCSRQHDVHSAPVAKPKPFEDSLLQCVLEATGCQDQSLAEQCLMESGGEINLAIVELLQLMALQESDVAPVPVASAQVGRGPHNAAVSSQVESTACSQRHECKAPGPHHLSNRERKEAAKAARKEAARESKRERKAAGRTHSDIAEDNSLGSRTI